MRNFTGLVLAAFCMFCFSCKEQHTDAGTVAIDTIPAMVLHIQRCSRLYATECRIHKIITHEDKLRLKGTLLKQDYDIALPMGERKVAIPLDVTVKAYVDFSGFTKNNVVKNGNRIEIVLPDPVLEITGTRIDHKNIKEYVPLTRKRFTDAELSAYERAGRDSVIAAVARLDLLSRSRESAANVIVPIVTSMGYSQENVVVTFRKTLTNGDVLRTLNKNGK